MATIPHRVLSGPALDREETGRSWLLLFLLFLGVTIWALRRDRPRHRWAGPEVLAWAAAVATVGGLWISGVVVGAGLTLLIGASAWNWKLVRSRRTMDPKTVEA